MDCSNFDITVGDEAGDVYPVSAWFDESTTPSQLTLDPKSQPLAHLLEWAAKGISAGSSNIDTAEELGQALYDALFGGELGEFLRLALQRASNRRECLRLRLGIDDLTIRSLPWEFLFDGKSNRLFATDPSTPLVRYLSDRRAYGWPQELKADLPLRMLMVVPAVPDLEVEDEIDRVRNALDKENLSGELIELTVLGGREKTVTFEDLLDLLDEDQKGFDILHFSGHGDTEGGRGRLRFNDEQGGSHWIGSRVFARRLKKYTNHMRLAVLNSCEGGVSAPRAYGMRSLLGTAPALIQNDFAAVVAMQYKILDTASLVFARAFYRALTIGQTAGLVDAAITEARGRLEVEFQGHRSFATPVLFIHAPDGRIFELPAVSARADTVSSDLGDGDKHTVLEPAVAIRPHRVPVEFDWVTIPSGEFPMGSNSAMGKRAPENERPQHPVGLAEFRIARVPVTNAQYEAFVDATGQTAPQHWEQGAIPPGKEEHPVVFVSWHDAQAFCQWAGVRLPTEAEWEKAARGTDGRLWPWGNESPDENRCNFNKDADEAGTTPVDKYSQGASPYGVLDMAGNVWEWVSSLFQDYHYTPYDGRENPDAQGGRVLRGGSFLSDHEHVRCANRAHLIPTTREDSIGFRVASLEP